MFKYKLSFRFMQNTSYCDKKIILTIDKLFKNIFKCNLETKMQITY